METTKVVKKIRNKCASKYEATDEVAHKETWKEVLEELIGGNKYIKILDATTKNGIIANMFRNVGYNDVIGIDLSEGMIRIDINHPIEQKYNIKFKYAKATELPFEDQSFDIVISSRLLWTLTEPEVAIKEWSRVFKKGGQIIAINEFGKDLGKCYNNLHEYIKNINVKELPYGNVDRKEILKTYKAYYLKNVAIEDMPGCHLLNSNGENLYAFIGTK